MTFLLHFRGQFSGRPLTSARFSAKIQALFIVANHGGGQPSGKD
jgi:hypothetical protein